MNRLHYIVRRLLLAIPTFIGITLVCFALTRILPGGPVEMRLMRMRGSGGGGEGGGGAAARGTHVTEAQRRELNRQFGFDRPFLSQYWKWLAHDRMGLLLPSYEYNNKTAWQMIRARMPVSLWFGITGFVLSYLICIPLGITKALRHGTTFDLGTSVAVFVGYAIPALALGMILKTLLCGTVEGLWDIFPLGGFESADAGSWSWAARFADRARHMLLPVICYVIGSFAVLTLLMKNSLLEQVGADYVRTALAKGATARRAVWGHAVRNALIPIATGFGSILSLFFAGSFIIETIFEIHGIGRLSLDAIASRDYAIFMAMLSLTASLQLVGNILSDFCYLLIDPRVHFGGRNA
ncbi:MAG: ABC transporter permease subunit [Kiritimatiellia bacterium]